MIKAVYNTDFTLNTAYLALVYEIHREKPFNDECEWRNDDRIYFLRWYISWYYLSFEL